MRRRTFVSSLAGGMMAATATLGASNRLRLGIDAYSIRGWGWKAPELLDYAAAQRVDVLQFSNLHELESLDADYLNKIRDRAKELNLELELGGGSICPTSTSWKGKADHPRDYLTKCIQAAAGLGAPLVKLYVGSSADRQGGDSVQRHIDETLKVLAQHRSLARDSNVRIAMENHSGDLLARELVQLIEAAGKDWVGCCLDSGNPLMTLEDPHAVLEILGPYTITSHIRDSAVYAHSRGAAWQWVALGDGAVDWPKFVARFRDLCPRAAFLLENITGRPPRVTPFLEPEIWNAFRNHRTSDFAAYLSFVRQNRLLLAPMIIADTPGQHPQIYKDALKQQQRHDLEKGLRFAEKLLGRVA